MNEVTHYIIKGDLSGIQEFIFNIKSKGAARALKARSFHIEMLGWLAEKRVTEMFKGAERIYNGGGNFYVKVPKETWNEDSFKKLQSELLNGLPKHGSLGISLNVIPYNANKKDSYGETIKALNELSARSKLNRFNVSEKEFDFFTPFETVAKDDQKEFVAFADELRKNEYRNIIKAEEASTTIEKRFGYQVKLHQKEPGTPDSEKIYRHIRLWESKKEIEKYREFIDELEAKTPRKDFHEPEPEHIVEFEYLSYFAYTRTGTDKLGILKLDIDNLGKLFTTVGDEGNNKQLSTLLDAFFKKELNNLLDESFSYKVRVKDGKNFKKDKEQVKSILENGKMKDLEPYKISIEKDTFRNNLYVVFAGGDDSFIIGGWDAVIEFGLKLQERFKNYVETTIKTAIKSIKAPVTLSAGITLVDAHYPVVKFAELAEAELSKAKKNRHATEQDASGKPLKNSISFLGQVFTWDEFRGQVKVVKDVMQEMVIKYDAPKNILQKIIESFDPVGTTEWQTLDEKKPFHPALLWRFPYYFRDIRKKEYFMQHYYKLFFGENTDKELGGYYKKYLKDSFSSEKEASQVLPSAARWTEFLTRQKQQENG